MKAIDASPEGFCDITWSIDGSWIAYVRGADEACLANAATGEIRVLGPGRSPSFTPTHEVVLERGDEVVLAGGAGTRTLVGIDEGGKGTPKRWPVVAPDGGTVALAVCHLFDKTSQGRNAYPYRHFLALTDLAGSHLTVTPDQWYGGSATWFPDSGRLVHFEFDSTGGARLHVVDRTGRHLGTPGGGLHPAVSPDGTRIAARTRGGGTLVVFMDKGAGWNEQQVEGTVARLPQTSGRVSANPPAWLDNRLVLVDEGDKVFRIDTRRDKPEELKLPVPTQRGRRTMAISPDREMLALETLVDGRPVLGLVKVV